MLTTKQAANIIGVSPMQISRLVRGGHLEPAIKAPGKRGAYLFEASEIEYFKTVRELQTAGKATR